MAATLGDLIDEIHSQLLGYTADVEQITSLSVGIDADDVVFQVEDATVISRGHVEIDSELVRVLRVDVTNNLVYVAAGGRGEQGSTAAAHDAGARVTFKPQFPRHRIHQTINSVIRTLYPQLFGVATDVSNTATPTKTTYELPTAVRSVISVSYETTGPTGAWAPVQRWRLDRAAATTDYDTGVSIDILQGMEPGRTIKVVYRKELSELAAESDLLTASGLQESARDAVVWGALARLLPALEFVRLQGTSTEQSDRARFLQPGSAGSAARQALQMQSMCLEQERLRLQQMYPTTAHLTR